MVLDQDKPLLKHLGPPSPEATGRLTQFERRVGDIPELDTLSRSGPLSVYASAFPVSRQTVFTRAALLRTWRKSRGPLASLAPRRSPIPNATLPSTDSQSINMEGRWTAGPIPVCALPALIKDPESGSSAPGIGFTTCCLCEVTVFCWECILATCTLRRAACKSQVRRLCF